jgi:hypothetical protein
MRPVLIATALIATAVIACVGVVPPALAQHDAHHAPPAVTAPTSAQRFATDPVLRENMRGIRKSVDALAHYEMGHMGPEQAVMLAGNIEGHVKDIIANCKLPPDADAALHAVIVPMLQAATALKADPGKQEPIATMRESLAQYRRQFDDPELDSQD